MEGESFYLLTFDSASHSIGAERLARKRFRVCVLPTPTEITAGCGLSLRFSDAGLCEICAFLKDLRVPCALYRIEKKGQSRQAANYILNHSGEVNP